MDKFDKKISEIFKKEIKTSNSYEYTLKSTLNDIEILSNNVDDSAYEKINVGRKTNFRIILSFASCLILCFGIIKSNDLSELMYAKYDESKNVEIAVAATGINAKFENVCHLIGFALIFLLMIIVTINDIIKLF